MKLHTDKDLARDINALIDNEPKFKHALDATGPIPLRRREGGYVSIIRTIIGQQVSVASANAIWGKLDHAGMTDLSTIAKTSFDDLRALGLSRQKATYLLALAEANIDFDKLPALADIEVIKTLTAVKGIGNWTAEIYLMFALGRPDVFAHNDLALQESTRILFELDARPSEKEMKHIALNWSPYRNAASQLLWAYYHFVKDRHGI